MSDQLAENITSDENEKRISDQHDPLLSCLMIACRLFGKSANEASLKSGLPVKNKLFGVDLFIRAAERVGIEAKVIKRGRLENIPRLACPAVLILRDGQYCLLKDIDHEKQQVLIYYSDFPDDCRTESFEKFAQLYTGRLILIKEKYRVDKRVEGLSNQEGKHWFWSALSISLPLYKSMIFASLLINLLALVSPLFVMNVYDRVVPNNALETLWVLATGVVIAVCFDFFVKWLRFYAMDASGKKADIILSSRIMEHVLSLETKEHPKSVGTFSKSLQDFESIRDFITSSSIATLIDIPFTIIMLVVIWMVGGWLVAVPLVAIACLLIYSLAVQPILRGYIEKTFRSSSARNATLIESLIGLETVQLHGAETHMQTEWEQHTGFLAKWSGKAKMLTHSTTMITGFIQQLSTVFLIVMGVYLISEHTITMGALIASNMLAGRAMGPIGQLVSLLMRYFNAKTALKSLDNLMAKPKRRNPSKQYVRIAEVKGEVSVESVVFTYPEHKIKTLENLNFKIKSREKVAIIGRIGSGKSTLGKMLLGMYAADEGIIRIDGLDITQIDPVNIQEITGCVPQDTHIFFGTVRDNITLGTENFTDQQVVEAVRKAGVDSFTDLHPEGLDMPLLERGSNLSGGQRQAIVLARLFIKNPAFIVMDEPTSSMDQKSELQIRNHLKDFCQDKTVVIITHRMPLLDLVDRLIIIDRGRIVADGEKSQVLEALKHGKIIVS